MKLSESCLINMLEEGLKLGACGGRGRWARKLVPSQKHWGLLNFPLRGPHLGGQLALPPHLDT